MADEATEKKPVKKASGAASKRTVAKTTDKKARKAPAKKAAPKPKAKKAAKTPAPKPAAAKKATTGKSVQERVAKAPASPRARAVTPEERNHMIAEAAYYRAERRGFAGGDAAADWLSAEAEIDARLARDNVNVRA